MGLLLATLKMVSGHDIDTAEPSAAGFRGRNGKTVTLRRLSLRDRFLVGCAREKSARNNAMNETVTSGSRGPVTGGAVEESVLQDLVYANHICAEQGVLDGYGHVSIRHPKAPDRYFLSRSLSPAVITVDDIMEYDLDSRPVDQRGRLMYLERCIHGEIYKARPDVNASTARSTPRVNARLQAQAIALGGEITFMDPQECALITGRKDLNFDRPWRMWKERIGAK